MDLDRIIRDLGRAEAYPHAAADLEIHHTHISVVFLAGPWAYKVKKPVDLGFVDFTTPERRLHFCREEVRLNRRLAPEVYKGVVPLTEEGDGIRVEGDGPVVAHAVKMERLPWKATLRSRVERDDLPPGAMADLGRRLAAFHAGARGGDDIARYGRWEVVAANARENLEQSRDQVGRVLSSGVHGRLASLLEDRLEDHRDLIESRAAEGWPRDAHGDLHLEHIYLFPERPPPRNLVVVDCVEFNPRFRYSDPVSDMAFLSMDLLFHGRPDLERSFSDSWFEASGDREGRPLLPFYRSYRAAVRGKVEGITSADPEVPEGEREEALERARGHWLLALSELETPDARPALVLVGGLPGTGKTTLARRIARAGDFEVISTDRVRKSLAGLEPDGAAPAPFGEGIYSPEWTARTYRTCLREVERLLFRGRRVLVDAGFWTEERRKPFLEQARRWGVRSLFLVCRTDPETVRDRLGEGPREGPSDAGWEIHRQARDRWELPSPPTARLMRRMDTGAPPEAVASRALEHLAEAGLHSPGE